MQIVHETKIVKDGKEIIVYKGQCETEGVELIADFITALIKKVITNLNSPVEMPKPVEPEKEMD